MREWNQANHANALSGLKLGMRQACCSLQLRMMAPELIQNAYAKIGISSRAAAAVFAMEHGLASWGEFPIVEAGRRS